MVSGNRQTDEGSFRQSFTISRQVADLLRFSRCGSCRLFLAWPVSTRGPSRKNYDVAMPAAKPYRVLAGEASQSP